MPPVFRGLYRTSIEPRDDTNQRAPSLESGTYEEIKEYLERNGCIVTGRPGYDRCFYFDCPDGYRLRPFYPGQKSSEVDPIIGAAPLAVSAYRRLRHK